MPFEQLAVLVELGQGANGEPAIDPVCVAEPMPALEGFGQGHGAAPVGDDSVPLGRMEPTHPAVRPRLRQADAQIGLTPIVHPSDDAATVQAPQKERGQGRQRVQGRFRGYETRAQILLLGDVA